MPSSIVINGCRHDRSVRQQCAPGAFQSGKLGPFQMKLDECRQETERINATGPELSCGRYPKFAMHNPVHRGISVLPSSAARTRVVHPAIRGYCPATTSAGSFAGGPGSMS